MSVQFLKVRTKTFHLSPISKKKSFLLLGENVLQTDVPFFLMPLFLAILSWKQGNDALECTIFDLY